MLGADTDVLMNVVIFVSSISLNVRPQPQVLSSRDVRARRSERGVLML
jgi:hypothetical protein